MNQYLSLLRLPGASAFFYWGLVARLPISVTIVGVLLLVESVTGSYATAGIAASLSTLSNGLASPLQGRLMDQLGQSRVVGAVSVLYGGATALLILSVYHAPSILVVAASAAFLGAAVPQVGAASRARWLHSVGGDERVPVAMALESVGDEAVVISGNVVGTTLAVTVHPAAGVLAAGIAGCVGGLMFATRRASEPPVVRHRAMSGAGHRLHAGTTGLLVVSAGLFTMMAGAANVSMVGLADEHDRPEIVGVILGLWGLGSLTAGAISGVVAWRSPAATRLRLWAGWMVVVMTSLSVVSSLAASIVLLTMAGMALAPYFTAMNTVITETVPVARLTEGMALTNMGTIIGIAPGTALSGLVLERWGVHASFLVCAATGVVGLLTASALIWTLKRQRQAATASHT